MAFNQQLSVLGQVAPATTGTAGQVLVSAGSSASSYWASAIPVSAYSAQFNNNSFTGPSNAAFTFGTGDFTVEAWVYVTSSGKYNGIFNNGTTAAGTMGIYLLTGTNKVEVAFYGGTAVDSNAAIPLNTWTHIAVSRASSSVKIFINGAVDITSTNSFNNTSSGCGVGSPWSSSPSSDMMNGYISNLRVVKGLAVYTGAFTVPTSPLGTSQAAGTNIAAVTPSQVSLLTCNGPGLIDSSPNAFTLTNTSGVISSQFAPFSSFSAIARSATQTQTILTSGSGTYYTPYGVAWLRIRMVGGGGGGGGGAFGTIGSAGANTTFGTSFLTATGGSGADKGTVAMAPGGTGTISGATGTTIAGGSGTPGGYGNGVYYGQAGNGGSSVFGGAGGGSAPTGGAILAGIAGATNSGSGGAGGDCTGYGWCGHGGGAGGYVEAYISSPAASYAYNVGTAGAGGAAGSTVGTGSNGGAGGSGIIIVEENYAVSVVKKSTTQTILTSGSGTYTTPIGVVQLEIRMVGGGGGGAASNGGTAGSAGANTTFSTFNAGGGSASTGQAAYPGGLGGTSSGGTVNLTGGGGGAGTASYSTAYGVGAKGGSSALGGAGNAGGAGNGVLNGGAAGTNTGGGGGGAGVGGVSGWGGGGGGSGGYVEGYITNPATTYAYVIGTGGGGGTGGAYNGGGGGSGIIIIKEYY
jgi:hypothetical protein